MLLFTMRVYLDLHIKDKKKYILNLMIGGEPGYEANLWYLMKLSEGASLIDFFPVFFQQPPFHIIIVIPLSIVIFLFLYLPFYLFEKK